MKTEYPETAVLLIINDILTRLHFARNIGRAAKVEIELFNLYDEVEKTITDLKSKIDSYGFSTKYCNMLSRSLDKLATTFSTTYGNDDRSQRVLADIEIPIFKAQQERSKDDIERAFAEVRYQSNFFLNIGFLNDHLVVVGSNGSGKTFLAGNLMGHIKNNGVIVASRRIMNVPTFDSIKGYSIVKEELKNIQISDKSNRVSQLENRQDEFSILLQHLISEDIMLYKKYADEVRRSAKDGLLIEPLNSTNLEIVLSIWSELFPHLNIFIEDGLNLKINAAPGFYAADALSDGEKVALFLIAQVIQCPKDGFIIVDEPEMYLHPTIHKQLWNRLEEVRLDSKFIYLTHDLEFAASRINAKKLWLQGYSHPDRFQLQEIPKNEIPRALLLELLGSRQDILFCEGEEGSLDERIYSVLFPEYLIKPVGGCLSVINFTKAFNKLPLSTTKAIGIVDGDYLPQERIDSLRSEGIYCIDVPDVENMLLDMAVIQKICASRSDSSQCITKIENNVIETLRRDKSMEVARYVSTKIDHYFKDSNVSIGKDLESVNSNYTEFISRVDINSWSRDRASVIQDIIDKKDYKRAVQILKNKGLSSIVEHHLKMKGYINKAILILQTDEDVQASLRTHVLMTARRADLI